MKEYYHHYARHTAQEQRKVLRFVLWWVGCPTRAERRLPLRKTLPLDSVAPQRTVGVRAAIVGVIAVIIPLRAGLSAVGGAALTVAANTAARAAPLATCAVAERLADLVDVVIAPAVGGEPRVRPTHCTDHPGTPGPGVGA